MSQPRLLPTDDSQPPPSQSLTPVTVDLVPSTSFITEPTTTATISSQTLDETQLIDMGEVNLKILLHHCDRSESSNLKAPPTGKPSLAPPVQKSQSRSSSRLPKARQIDDPLSLPLNSLMQPQATDDNPQAPPKPKRATRGRAAAKKGKTVATRY